MHMEEISFRDMGELHVNSVLITKSVTGVDQFIQVDQLKRNFQSPVLNDKFINI